MHQHIPSDSLLQKLRVEMVSCAFDTAEGSCGSAASGVQGYRIIVIELAKAVGGGEGAFEEAVEEDLMLQRIYTYLSLVILIQSPANIVMTADIVDEGAMVLHGEDVFSHMLQ